MGSEYVSALEKAKTLTFKESFPLYPQSHEDFLQKQNQIRFLFQIFFQCYKRRYDGS